MTFMRMVVTAEVPAGVSRKEWANYISDSVATWKGSLAPDGSDPLFFLDGDTVVVTDETRGKRYVRTTGEET